MKKDTTENKKKEMPKEINKEIFMNILIAVFIMIYCIFLNLGYKNIQEEYFEIDIKVFSMIILVIGLVIMERAYKKDSGKIAIIAIEILILAFFTLLTSHVTNLFDFNFQLYILTSSYIFSIYYIFKCIILYTKDRRRYLESLSDIKEIVKKR